MELLYLWIENDWKTIKDQSFNFSNHIKFSLTSKTDKSGIITLNENPNYIDNFFGDEIDIINGNKIVKSEGKIVNITAIIGENGVGKTNLFNYLIDLLTDRLSTGLSFIIAFKDLENKTIKIYHTIENYELLTDGSIEGYKIDKPIEQTQSEHFGNLIKNPSKFVDNFGLIFYNPIFDQRDFQPNISKENREYIDVSTNALIHNDLIREGESYPENLNQISMHKFSNIRRQLDMLINSGLGNMDGIKFPKEVIIIFHREPLDYKSGKRNLTYESEEIYEHLDKLINEAWQITNSNLSNIEGKSDRKWFKLNEGIEWNEEKNLAYKKALAEKLKVEFSYSFINNFFLNLNVEYHEDIKIKLQEIKGEGLFDRASYFFNNQKWEGLGKSKKVHAGALYDSILNLIDNINLEENPVDDNANSFVTTLEGGIEVLSNYENYILSLPNDYRKNFISINWRNISSGEKALIDLYSRLFFAKNYRLDNKAKSDENINPFIYLIIDEGEVGFHPQWQSEYLYNLISFVQKLFINNKVQIILSSHSPFVISDLPKENLIFLEKVNGSCQVVSFSEEQTFAANIHRLFAYNFFLKDGVIGKFAKTKLQEELKPLLEEHNSQINFERLNKIISIIGEPVLQSKLNELLNSKLSV